MISNVQIVWKSLRDALNFRSILFNAITSYARWPCNEKQYFPGGEITVQG